MENTSYEDIYNRFINKIIKDKKFFHYDNLTDQEISNIIDERCLQLLDTATIHLQGEVSSFDIDFLDRDEIIEEFNFELTKIEQELIAEKMYVLFFREEEVKLKEMQKYLGNDIKMFSPAEERKTFMAMLSQIEDRYDILLDNYNSRKRDGSGYNLAGVSEITVDVESSWI